MLRNAGMGDARSAATSRQHQVRVGACGWIGKNGASASAGWFSTDISAGQDFLLAGEQPVDAIVTNPPYNFATQFIGHALRLTTSRGGKVAMLLRTDFDHAKTRRHLFSDCPAFARKIVLTKRVRWIENSTGQPSFNHVCYIWDHKHTGKPTLEYDLQH